MLKTDQPWYPSSHEMECLIKLTEPIPKAQKLYGLQVQLAVKGTCVSLRIHCLSKLD